MARLTDQAQKPPNPINIPADSPSPPIINSPPPGQQQTQNQSPIITEPAEPKNPIRKFVKKGINQFSWKPQVQKFNPPPPEPIVRPTPQPISLQSEKAVTIDKPKFLSPLKIIILIFVLLIMGTVTAAATLVATNYTIYEPSTDIKNFLEKTLSGNIFK